MTNLNAEWWQKVAGMNRRELLDDLVRAAEAISDAEEALKAHQKAEALRESVVIAHNRAEAELSLRRLGRSPHEKCLRIVLSNHHMADQGLRGMKLREEHVLMIPGWARGKYAEAVKENLMICGANWQNCRYAPSPETDRAEGLSNWGRTEAAVVDDMLSTVNSLLSRTLERTAES
jgi:hypothetical protein